MPNKLVKRSTSQRALSKDQAQGTFLKRPATSHQRSATLQEWTLRETSYSTPATPYLSGDVEPIWRPFFERGYPRKRHTSVNTRDNPSVRTISPSAFLQPTLMLGSEIEVFDDPNDRVEEVLDAENAPKVASTGRERVIRSLSSVNRATRRRHFTDPTVKVTKRVVNGTMTPATNSSPASPLDVESRPGPHSYSSSPPFVPIQHKFSFKKRQSTVPSDPTTVSSDNDTRVFTDDDSMDFQSDSAYDSLTTRATVSSHSAFRTPKLDALFSYSQTGPQEEADTTLASLVQKATLGENVKHTHSGQSNKQLRGIGIAAIEEDISQMDWIGRPGTPTTPSRSPSLSNEDYNMTPIPQRLQYFGSPLKSSPPVLTTTAVSANVGTPEFVGPQRQEHFDIDDIDWSPKSDKRENGSNSTLRQDTTSQLHATIPSPDLPMRSSYPGFIDEEDSESDRRQSSIFDWSEHQKVGVEGQGGLQIRPKTVHGKQGYDGPRSRSSGRKGPTQMHLRSQSVPNSRDPNAEQPPPSTTKFGTWGLGHKPVSEEWSDDFEFDEGDDEASPQISSSALIPTNRGTARGVKVPQAIIDRQASVRIQFGQVQEFMLLVEELKSLRTRGAALQLLETHSKQLWKDAESIIDLATINNEEDDLMVRPCSPTPSDMFDDESPVASRIGPDRSTADELRRNSSALRTVSSPATPPHGRPRGESLAQAKNLLQSIHQNRSGFDSSPMEPENYTHRKLPFDTQDLNDLVVRSGVITRALKEIVRKAEGFSISPSKTPPKTLDPAFSRIFNAPDTSPCPPFRKPGLPKSKSANSYLLEKYGDNTTSTPTSPTPTALIL